MARTKSEKRRKEIVRVASEIFLENGFERTSMSTIAERLGGSKATLYSYFKSKEELFLAVLDDEIETNAGAIVGTAAHEPDLRKSLIIVGTGYLMQRLSLRPTRYFRMVSGQAEESAIGRHFWINVLKPAWMIMCHKFQELIAEGRLRDVDPWQATVQFKGLMDTDLVERRLLGVVEHPDLEECRAVAARGVDVFLAAYGAERDSSTVTSGLEPGSPEPE
ncbi:MAG TPA: TetR/AcrR family transcriptional regulator [Croceibacterium sp.]|nr:TetR/AcrR family transcriptional regulator [Croceibacterium sp.]